MFEEDMYVVIAFDEEHPAGAICSIDSDEPSFATKKICKKFIKTMSKYHKETQYEIYKLKAKETI